jgi:transketolase C-terminal domain/subunit
MNVEDKYKEGGIGEEVISEVEEEKNINVKKMDVKEVNRYGKKDVMLEKYGISEKKIVNDVKKIVI